MIPSKPSFALNKYKPFAGRALSIVLCLLLLLPAIGADFHRNSVPTRHVPDAITNGSAKLMGAVPATENLHLSIQLRLRNEAALDSLLKQIYDPTSAKFHQFLTVEEFTEQFGPTKSDYDAVVAFAESNGLTVKAQAANRMIVTVEGPAKAVQNAFHVKMNYYRHPSEARNFMGPDREPTVDLSVPLLHISLDSDYKSHISMLHRQEANLTTHSNTTGSGPSGLFLGSDFRAAYTGGTSLTGAGQVVGLFEFGPYNLSDVQ